MQNEEHSTWYSQPWAWFIFAIPFLTVIAGVLTYFIAANQPHSMVEDDYFKKGLAINQSIDRQKLAAELGIKVELQQDSANQLMLVKIIGNITANAQLKILFSHPTQPKMDYELVLESVGNQEFMIPLPDLVPAEWHVLVYDEAERWLVKGRWQYPDNNRLIMSAQ